MLIEHIERIRSLPRRERERRAYMYAGTCTAVIVGIWLTVVYVGRAPYLPVDDTAPVHRGANADVRDLPSISSMADTFMGNQFSSENESEHTEQHTGTTWNMLVEEERRGKMAEPVYTITSTPETRGTGAATASGTAPGVYPSAEATGTPDEAFVEPLFGE